MDGSPRGGGGGPRTCKKVNLALQGGGAHGAVTWGVLDRLLEDDCFEVDSISGTSAGAVNAAALAYGVHLDGNEGARRLLHDLWKSISDAGAMYSPIQRSPFEKMFGDFNLDDSIAYKAFEMFTRTLSPYQFNPFGINPLKDVLLKCIDFEELRSCTRSKLFISATNVRSGKVHVFNTEDASVDVVLASACLPFLFQAVEVDGQHYWDGGYMGNPVLFPFFYESESLDTLIIHVNPIDRPNVPTSTSDIFNRINEISFNSSLMREMRAINFVQKLLRDGWIKEEHRDDLREVRIHSIRSDRSLVDLSVASKFNTEWSFLTDLRDRGRAIADEWVRDNFDKVGVESSLDLQAMFGGQG